MQIPKILQTRMKMLMFQTQETSKCYNKKLLLSKKLKDHQLSLTIFQKITILHGKIINQECQEMPNTVTQLDTEENGNIRNQHD